MFFAFIYLVNDYVFGGQFAGENFSEGSIQKQVYLITYDKTITKRMEKDKKFGGLTRCKCRKTDDSVKIEK